MPKMFWKHDEGRGVVAPKGGGEQAAPSRAALVVPPGLQGKITLPMAEGVATSRAPLSSAMIPAAAKKMVAGRAVSLDARIYSVDAAALFSAVIDAMTALNIPVESVDSPSGTVTSDWIRKDAASSAIGGLANIFGGGGGAPIAVRHRFVVRVLRQSVDGEPHSRLEIRTLAQVFQNRHWMNRVIKRRVSNELFSAVEERVVESSVAAPPQGVN
ncbi:MAG: hypothetical protein Q9M13_10030 [Mariprofundales bacterium]|nr:hypothetical protein [Mariprofundales bacterium]